MYCLDEILMLILWDSSCHVLHILCRYVFLANQKQPLINSYFIASLLLDNPILWRGPVTHHQLELAKSPLPFLDCSWHPPPNCDVLFRWEFDANPLRLILSRSAYIMLGCLLRIKTSYSTLLKWSNDGVTHPSISNLHQQDTLHINWLERERAK